MHKYKRRPIMKKNQVKLFSVLILLILSLLVFSACKKEKPFNGINTELGIMLEGGGFDEESSLIASRLTESINIKEATKHISPLSYNTTAELFVYYINVTKNGSTVQPSGNVRITLPEPNASYTDYVLFHVKGSDVETLSYTLENGKISFEVNSLSYFVIAHSHVHQYSSWSDAGDGENHVRSCACGYVATEKHNFDNGQNITAEGKLYTCQSCGFSYTHYHEYSNFLDAEDGDNHVGTCSCGKTSSEPHDYGNGVETDTKIQYTCQTCAHKKLIPLYVSLNIVFPAGSGCTATVNGVEYDANTIYKHGTEVTVVINLTSEYEFKYWESATRDIKTPVLKFTVGTDDFTLGKEKITLLAALSKINEEGALDDLPIV